ncbi:hypothetical protein IQ07DRAFT_549867 [Pyrenochaeta sp. DS3sAY3a]|nr:hypothetical protein IQ07DRAFT_549867 [Pyrenochaeta sp. DS3sAY3a]
MDVLGGILLALPYLQWLIIVALLFVTGIAWSFNFWIIPIIKLNPSVSAVAQFEETSRRGGRWLEPINACFAFTFAMMALLLSQHSDPSEATNWKAYAMSSATLFQVAWWERVMIFPLERSAARLKQNKVLPENSERIWMEDSSRAILHQIMDKWCRWHIVRATLPLIASLIALSTKIDISL